MFREFYLYLEAVQSGNACKKEAKVNAIYEWGFIQRPTIVAECSHAGYN